MSVCTIEQYNNKHFVVFPGNRMNK